MNARDDGPPPGGWKRGEVYRLLCEGLDPDLAKRFELERYARMNAGNKGTISEAERARRDAELDRLLEAEQANEG